MEGGLTGLVRGGDDRCMGGFFGEKGTWGRLGGLFEVGGGVEGIDQR